MRARFAIAVSPGRREGDADQYRDAARPHLWHARLSDMFGDRAGAERWLALASRQGDLAATALLAEWAAKDGKDPVQALGLTLVVQAGASHKPAALTKQARAGMRAVEPLLVLNAVMPATQLP